MQSILIGLLASVAATAGGSFGSEVFGPGRDPARGELVNRTVGIAAQAQPDPGRPTIVIIHGLNPWSYSRHYTIGQRLGQGVGQWFGDRVNVLEWDWNSHTLVGPLPQTNIQHAVGQGRQLAQALLRARIDPARLHLIGQSSGAMVAASASGMLAEATGRRVAQLTLIDPALHHHHVIFHRLQAASMAGRVENYWVPGLSGFGGPVQAAGVANLRIDLENPLGWRGLLKPSQCDHLSGMRWYLETAEQLAPSLGFGACVLVSIPTR